MLIFVDDSGDAGFKLKEGSSLFFVIAMVIFDDELEAEKTAIAIKDLKRSLKFPEDVEFRFFKTSKNVRVKFLKAIEPFKFRVRALVVEKALIHSSQLREDKQSFYGYAIKTVLKYSEASVLDARVKIDGSGDRLFRKSFLGYLRRELNSGNKKIIKNCKLVDSKSNVLIQMADMIAGSIRRSRDLSKTDSKAYRSIIKKHIEDEWSFK